MKPNCLIIDDEKSIRQVLADTLKQEGYEVKTAANGEEGLDLAVDFNPRVVLLDIRMPGLDGTQVLDKLLSEDPTCRIIMLTAHGNLRTAVDTMARGAYHYLAKPFDLDEVVHVVNRASGEWELKNQVTLLKNRLLEKGRMEGMEGNSPAMEEVFKVILQAAPTQADILITGESGTGKELAARAIHRKSNRKGDFIAVNCAALPANLLESELFGHLKGAFTGAEGSREGYLKLADQGTLFLDEIGAMPQEVQAKFLRAIQEKRFFPVGGEKEISSDFRVIAATNENLEKGIERGSFREDLYYRLAVINLKLPPLRERKEDIPLLVSKFLEDYNTAYKKNFSIDPSTLDWLKQQKWPGNIRQLKNAIHQAVILGKGEFLVPSDFMPPDSRGQTEEEKPSTLEERLQETEREHILKALSQCKGNKSKAAELLGITRKTLYNKMKNLGLE